MEGRQRSEQRRFWKRDSCCGTGLNRIGGGRSLWHTQVQEQFNYEAVEEDWYGVWCGGSEESPAESVVYISNLADCVTNEMLEGTFGQIGSVLAAGVEKAGCGWVEFERAEDVMELWRDLVVWYWLVRKLCVGGSLFARIKQTISLVV